MTYREVKPTALLGAYLLHLWWLDRELLFLSERWVLLLQHVVYAVQQKAVLVVLPIAPLLAHLCLCVLRLVAAVHRALGSSRLSL